MTIDGTSAHVSVDGLRIEVPGADGRSIVIVDDVSFAIPRGEVLALIGESGSGKTTIALSLMGYCRPGARIAAGRVRVGEEEITRLDGERLRALRGRRIAYVAQNAGASFNPSRKLMDQVVEPALSHGLLTREAAEAKAVDLFRGLGLPEPETIGWRYPHQLSGGQLQRLMAAMALLTGPELVILDEPTTALDVTTQIGVLQAFRDTVRKLGTTAVYVSHDLAVVAQMADRVVVLNGGRIREAGAVREIVDTPRDDYTRTLMAAARPAERSDSSKRETPVPLLRVDSVWAGYGGVDRTGQPNIPVLRDISLTLQRGEMLGVIGESGSGKSTLARVIAGLLPASRGEVRLDGGPLPPGLRGRTKEMFGRIQMVFQNADTALNPAHSIRDILARPLAFFHGVTGRAADAEIAKLLDQIRLPKTILSRRAPELSGGQKQRVNLARALAARPDVILCDEVTSALDTIVGAAIIDLLAELRRDLGLAMMFISHDISTVRSICDEIMVLYLGDVAHQGPRAAFETAPWHPYTDLLVRSVPEMRIGWLDDARGADSLPPVAARSSADLCRFLDRCACRQAGLCDTRFPIRRTLPAGDTVLCHLDALRLGEAAEDYSTA